MVILERHKLRQTSSLLHLRLHVEVSGGQVVRLQCFAAPCQQTSLYQEYQTVGARHEATSRLLLSITLVRAGLVGGQQAKNPARLIYGPRQESNCRWWNWHPSTSPKTLKTKTLYTNCLCCLKYQKSWVCLTCIQKSDFRACLLQQCLSNPGWQVHVWKLYTTWKWSNLAHLHSFTSTTQTSDKEASLC